MSLPARTGWDWLKAGFGLLRTQPGILMVFLFANVTVFMLLLALPLVGTLLIPSLSMAIWEGCRQIDNGKRVNFDVVLTGFKRPVLKPLFKLGLAYLALAGVLMLVALSLLSREVLEAMAKATPGSPLVLAPGETLSLMLVALLQALGLLVLSFAAPLVTWQAMKPGKAIFYSIFGVLGAKRAFLVLVLSWTGLFFVGGTVLSIVLGNGTIGRVLFIWVILVLLLVAQCALYAAYRQIYGAPDEPSKPDLIKR